MKKVLVTGANKGIGYETARHLGKAGWQVIIGARNEQRALDAIAKLKADKVDVIGWQFVDLSDNDSIVRSAEEITVK